MKYNKLGIYFPKSGMKIVVISNGIIENLLREVGIEDMKLFKNRLDAGKALAHKMVLYKDKPETIVLAFRKAGLPVAYEVANKIQSQLEIFLLSNVKVMEKKPIAIGTIASGGIEVMNSNTIQSLDITQDQLFVNILLEKKKLVKRQHNLRGNRAYPDLSNRTIILVDDGVAGSSRIRAIVTALKKISSKHIIFAVPIIASHVKSEIEPEVDQLVTVAISQTSSNISDLYENYSRPADYKVKEFLS